MGNDKTVIPREKTVGVRYALTKELKSHIQLMRKEIKMSANEMADKLGLKIDTYKNIEKETGSTSITAEILEKIFEIYKSGIGCCDMPKDDFIIIHIKKLLLPPNKIIDNLDSQDWLKALYMKYQKVILTDALKNRLERYGDLKDTVALLNKNRHIKLKTKIKYPNEVYINLDKETYPDLGGFPFWCIKYELSEKDIFNIVSGIEKRREIRYSTLFSLLVILALEELHTKNYDEIYGNIYFEMRSYQYENAFEIVERIQARYDEIKCSKTFALQNANGGDFFEKLENLGKGNIPPHIMQLIRNCIEGRDNFINAVNVDFSPIYNASEIEIENFNIALKELINTPH